MRTIDLNADVGEASDEAGIAAEERLAGYLSSLNIACGGHAGDEASMTRMVRVAMRLGLGIGAHPGYPDPANFGRMEMEMIAAHIETSVAEQIDALRGIARRDGGKIGHVKPHGALYHAAQRREIAEAIGRAAMRVAPSAILVGQCGSPALAFWRAMGCTVAAEAFADRVYETDGSLRSRSKAGAVIEDEARAAEQALRIAASRHVICADGSTYALEAATLCVHGDTAGAEKIAQAVRRRLEADGMVLRRLQQQLGC